MRTASRIAPAGVYWCEQPHRRASHDHRRVRPKASRPRGHPLELVEHQRTLDSTHTAEAAHIPGTRLAKGTVLKDEDGFLIAIVPATRRVDLGAMHRRFGRPLGLATEAEITTLFADCEPGAVPPLGAAYGIESVLDDSLMEAPDVYFEAGDHCGLVHVSGADFRKLVGDAQHGEISRQLA